MNRGIRAGLSGNTELQDDSEFWEPLTQAAASGQLGRTEDGQRAAEALLDLKPDFPSRGRVLIEHFIKFEEIIERVVEGLRKAGLDIE